MSYIEILERIKSLIDLGKVLGDNFNENNYKVWLNRVRSTIDRISTGKLKEHALEIIENPCLYVTFSGAPADHLRNQFIDHYLGKIKELLPILEALYDDVSFFEKEEMSTTAKKIKKQFEIECGIPGIVKGKVKWE